MGPALLIALLCLCSSLLPHQTVAQGKSQQQELPSQAQGQQQQQPQASPVNSGNATVQGEATVAENVTQEEIPITPESNDTPDVMVRCESDCTAKCDKDIKCEFIAEQIPVQCKSTATECKKNCGTLCECLVGCDCKEGVDCIDDCSMACKKVAENSEPPKETTPTPVEDLPPEPNDGVTKKVHYHVDHSTPQANNPT